MSAGISMHRRILLLIHCCRSSSFIFSPLSVADLYLSLPPLPPFQACWLVKQLIPVFTFLPSSGASAAYPAPASFGREPSLIGHWPPRTGSHDHSGRHCHLFTPFPTETDSFFIIRVWAEVEWASAFCRCQLSSCHSSVTLPCFSTAAHYTEIEPHTVHLSIHAGILTEEEGIYIYVFVTFWKAEVKKMILRELWKREKEKLLR